VLVSHIAMETSPLFDGLGASWPIITLTLTDSGRSPGSRGSIFAPIYSSLVDVELLVYKLPTDPPQKSGSTQYCSIFLGC
jgi:hypothetical protein